MSPTPPRASRRARRSINAATTLTNSFNQFDAQLSTIQSQAATQYAQLTGTTGQVQSDANQIATLNQSISAATAAGQNPNDLLDKRDSLIDDLSSLGKVSVSDPNNNGMLQVNFGDAATPLVNGTTVTWPQTMTAAAGGELGALLEPLRGRRPDRQLPLGSRHRRQSAHHLGQRPAHLDPVLHAATPRATISVAATAATIQTSTTANAGANDVALADRRRLAAAPPISHTRRSSLPSAATSSQRRAREQISSQSVSTRSTTSARASPASRSTRR